MRSFHDRMLAFVCALGFVIAATAMAHAGPYEDALVGLHRRLPERYRRCHRQSRRQRQSAGRAAVAGGGGRAADVQRRAEEGFHQDQRRQTSRCRHRQAVHRHAARRYRHCHRQQPAARHHRRGDRQLDADVGQLKSALRRGAGGVQVARRQRAAGPGQSAGRGKRPARQKGDERGACRHRAYRRRSRAPPTRSPPSP